MDVISVEVVRGGVVEARHRLDAVAVEGREVVASRGDPELLTLFRSSAKPIQALPLARLRPDLDDAELAIACASHLHRPAQLDAVRRLLAEADATEDDLECGPDPTRLEHNCSGKHAGMLLLCRLRGWPRDGYRLASHPCQQAMLAEIAAAAEVDPESLPPAIDGCGVVTVGLTLERMAHAFSRFEALDCGRRVADAMRARPELVRGDGEPDTELMPRARRRGEGRGRSATTTRPRPGGVPRRARPRRGQSLRAGRPELARRARRLDPGLRIATTR